MCGTCHSQNAKKEDHLKNLVIAAVSAIFIAGAYIYSFGVPDQIVELTGAEPVEDAPAQNAGRGGRRGAQTTTVVLSPLQERSYALILRTIGSATARRSSNVLASEAGEVVQTAIPANTAVQKGDVLLRLDDRAEVLALDIAVAERDLALSTVNRFETLKRAGNLSVTEVAVSEAANALRLAEINVGIAELNLQNRTILAPIDGQLGLSNIHVGDLMSVGDPIVTIDDTSTLLAEFEVPERSIALLSVGKEVLIGTPTYVGRIFRGPITAFDSRLDSVTRSATVQAEIDNSEGLLLSGMTFAVRIVDSTDPLPVVPSTAITWTRDGAGIWISEDGKAARHPVTIRYRDGDRVWVDTDVPLGASVVVEGASKLRDGVSVADANAAPARDKKL